MQAETFWNASAAHYDKKFGHGAFSLFTNMRYIIKTEGLSALFKGVQASLLGIVHPLVFFPMYEKLKIFFRMNYDSDKDKLSNKYILASSIISKVAASFCCYPHEVLRARL